MGGLSFYVPTALPTDQMIPQVRRVMRSIDANLPAEALRTLDNKIGQSISTERLILQLSAAFAILATALAMLGLYGVMAYNVDAPDARDRNPAGAGRESRSHSPYSDARNGMDSGNRTHHRSARGTGAGALDGKSAIWRKSFDAAVLTGAVLALAITAAAAAYVPASRAAKVSPTQALRYE